MKKESDAGDIPPVMVLCQFGKALSQFSYLVLDNWDLE